MNEDYFDFPDKESLKGFDVIVCKYTESEVLKSNGLHRHRDTIEIDRENVRRFRERQEKELVNE